LGNVGQGPLSWKQEYIMQNDLIYDVGMNNGDDTAYYLAQGYRVLAVEADPSLVTAGRSRFDKEIRAGTLHIVDLAISDRRETRTFYLSSKNVHSSFDLSYAQTSGNTAEAMEVECTSIREIFSEHGVPFYMKIDIEGADRYCIEQLEPADLPRFVSFERHRVEDVLHLRDLGFTRFKLIDQANMRQFHWSPGFGSEFSRMFNSAVPGTVARVLARLLRKGNFPHGSSGPFGEDTDGPWRSWEETCLSWLAFDVGHSGLPAERDWFDVHCAR
jgi:FkbM family methyltransferase